MSGLNQDEANFESHDTEEWQQKKEQAKNLAIEETKKKMTKYIQHCQECVDPKSQYPKEYEGLPADIEIPENYICKITGTIMVNPVVADDYNIYEKEAIEAYFRTHNNTTPIRSPFNIQITTTNVEPCHDVQRKIQEWYQQNKSKAGTTSTMAATAKPAAQGPAIKIAAGVAMEEATVPSKKADTGSKSSKAPAARTRKEDLEAKLGTSLRESELVTKRGNRTIWIDNLGNVYFPYENKGPKVAKIGQVNPSRSPRNSI